MILSQNKSRFRVCRLHPRVKFRAVRLARQGSNFIGFISPDGLAWTQVGSTVVITMSTAFIGVAANADTYGNMAQGTYDNVAINTAADFLLTSTTPTLSVIPGQSVNGSTTVNALNGQKPTAREEIAPFEKTHRRQLFDHRLLSFAFFAC